MLLLELPLVLVQDILQELVRGYTHNRSISLSKLLQLRYVNSTIPFQLCTLF
jgi:hypothetical protein